jgi:hypothetical protein
MARFRRRPACCQHAKCSGGRCGKCAYNPRSRYPVYHIVRGSQMTLNPYVFWAFALGLVAVTLRVVLT